MLSLNNLTKSASGLALALTLTSDGAQAVPMRRDPRIANLSSILQDALDMEADLLPFDDYQEEVQDRQGHHLKKTVHKHRFDDGIDIDLETNEEYDPLALQSYLSENMPKAV